VRTIQNVADLKTKTFQDTIPFSSSSWVIASPVEHRIKEKIEAVGTPLKDWNVQINCVVKTGFNDAFIVDSATKDALIAKDPKSEEILKPILRGRDIKRNGYDFADLWLLTTFPALNLDIDEVPAVKKHLLTFGKRRLEQSGKQGARKKTTHKWFEIQDSIAYWQDFEKQKIVYPDIMGMPRSEGDLEEYPYFCYDTEGFFVEGTNFLMTGEDIDLIFLFLLSDVGFYVFSKFYAGPLLGETGFRYKKAYLNELCVPHFDAQTAARLRAAITKLSSDRDIIERTLEEFFGFDEEERKTIRTYKKSLLTEGKTK
jgi:hypothetical protein